MNLRFLDTTLRDGAQASGVSFSVEDKLALIRLLDSFGVDIIEAGTPASNPKDRKLFEQLKGEKLSAKLSAFCVTLRPGTAAASDASLAATLAAETPVVTVVGKASRFQVLEVLGTTPEENLRIVQDTVRFFADRGREVIFDAEHFFDAYSSDKTYALAVLDGALSAGAKTLCLCDTNGGTLPAEIRATIEDLPARFARESLGIHCHNDFGLATANTLAAVEAGVALLQTTQLGLGERSGNADFETLLPLLVKRLSHSCAAAKNLARLTLLAREVSDLANLSLDESHPFVGQNAYTHKGGLHVDGVTKNTAAFEALAPELVGNTRRTVVSELSGKQAILLRARELSADLDKDSPELSGLLERIKSLEHEGYYYENADASLRLLLLEALGRRKRFFELLDFKLVQSALGAEEKSARCGAMMKIRVDGKTELAAAEGNGPVDAMDRVLRRALERFYPQVSELFLCDYKVRVLNSEAATGAAVRVLIQSGYKKERFGTVGVSTDITEASFHALCDAVEYFLCTYPWEKA